MISDEPNDIQPIVSIGLPVCNGANHIGQTLDTLLSQSFNNFELIISDNASTDETGSICRRYAANDARVRYILQNKNIGIKNNFSFVLRESVGIYFMWAAADDFFESDHLLNVVAELREHPEAIVAMSSTKLVLSDGSIKNIVKYKGCDNPNHLGLFAMAWRLASGKLYHFYIYGLFRRNFIETAFPAAPWLIGGDRMLMCAVAISGKFRYTEKETYMRRVYLEDAHLRYAKSDIDFSNLYKGPISVPVYSIKFLLYLIKSSHISLQNKLFAPFLAVRYAIFLTYSKISIIKKRLR